MKAAHESVHKITLELTGEEWEDFKRLLNDSCQAEHHIIRDLACKLWSDLIK